MNCVQLLGKAFGSIASLYQGCEISDLKRKSAFSCFLKKQKIYNFRFFEEKKVPICSCLPVKRLDLNTTLLPFSADLDGLMFNRTRGSYLCSCKVRIPLTSDSAKFRRFGGIRVLPCMSFSIHVQIFKNVCRNSYKFTLKFSG